MCPCSPTCPPFSRPCSLSQSLFYYSNLAAGLKHVEGVLYGEKESPKKADLRAVPRPFLVFACKSVGMFHRFVPAFGIRFL